jgi:hypothetical protein
MSPFRRTLRIVAPFALLSSLIVLAASGTAGASTSATFSSTAIGSSGTAPAFSQDGPWTMAWTYDCSASGNPGNFSVDVGGSTVDLGTNELGLGGSGTDYYYDTGTFTLSIVSGCDWTITVAPSSGAPVAVPVTFSSSQTGVTGNPQAFAVSAPWTMAWTYDCTNIGEPGAFSVDVNQPAGDNSLDVGPDETGMSGSGTDTYGDSGVFSLSVISQCDWSAAITSGTPTPSPTPSPIPPGKLINAPVTGMAATPDDGGYWVVDQLGEVAVFGDAAYYGSTAGSPLGGTMVGIVATPDGHGYWLVSSNGGVYTYGDAPFFGAPANMRLNQPVVGMAATSTGKGYWLVAADGGIFSFGDATFHGSTGAIRLNQPIVGIAADPATGGYWMVASDGGVFSFDAPFLGSMGGTRLNKPVVGMAVDPATKGYWLVAADGGIFSFGPNPFFGSTGNIVLNKPIVGMEAAPSGSGYRFVASDGGVFDFGSSQFHGSAA